MEAFLQKHIENEKFELVIDTKIFSKDIILKSAFLHLDVWYFFFKYNDEGNIVLQFTPKQWVEKNPEYIIWEFTDTLLETCLRDRLEKDNKTIRETIVEKAINGPLDQQNFVTLDTDAWEQVQAGGQTEANQIDFDKDIDEILKEIENDPDLQIDEAEIEKILQEIESETQAEIPKPTLSVNLEGLKKVKQQFKKQD